MANANDNLKRQQLFNTKTLAIGTHTIDPISISELQLIGNITIHFETTGSGTLAIDFKLSNSYNPKDRTGNFVKPSSGSSVVTGHTTGNDHLNIPMNNAEAFDLDFVVTNDTVTISAWLSMQ